MSRSPARPVIGILGLSEGRQSIGRYGLYRLGLEDASLLPGVVLGCAMANSARGVPLACLFKADAEMLVSHLREVHAQQGTQAAERIFRFVPAEHDAAVGVGQLLENLRAIGLEPGTLLLICGLEGRRQLVTERAYRIYFQQLQRGLRALKLYAVAVEQVDSAGERRRLLRTADIAGLGYISTQGQHALLERSRWAGLRRSALSPISLRVAGQALHWAEGPTATLGLGDRVLADAGSWPADVPRPALWQFFSDPAQLLAQAAVTNMPVCILAYRRGEAFESLARRVHALRRAVGRRASVYVREIDGLLRLTEQLTLSRVGMNALLPADLAVPEMSAFIEQARGQNYAHDVAEDFSAALKLAGRDQPSGYLPVLRFLGVVEALFEGRLDQRLEACLVYLPLRADAGHLQALQQLRLSRDGDVATADDDGLFLYLHGCTAEQVGLVLGRCFASDWTQLFDGHVIWSHSTDIEQGLAHLRHLVLAGRALDFTPMLQAWTEQKDELPDMPFRHEHVQAGDQLAHPLPSWREA